jgi:hypothetical protein
MKYSLHKKPKKWTATLATESEKVISQSELPNQNYYRHAIAMTL